MKLSTSIIQLFLLAMISSATGRQATRRKLAESRYLKAHPDAEVIPEEYTIEFTEGTEAEGMELIDDLITQHPGAKLLANYTEIFQGVSISGIPEDDMMDFLFMNLETISGVAEDSKAHATGVKSWGLDRIDQRDRPLNNDYSPKGNLNGAGVDIYILDTGVDTTHSEFTGRIVNGADFTNENLHGKDPHGHGTHVAGTAAGSTYGVANKANIIPVRVLGANGSGEPAWILKGIEWVVQQHKSGGGSKKSIINMSLGSQGQFQPYEHAITTAVDAGVVVVAAAGNDDIDACEFSPGFAPAAITVASSTKTDARSSFSNYGSCVDIFAPGSSIRSAKTGGGSISFSGTSMASPHVAGAAALLLQANPGVSASSIGTMLTDNASVNKIKRTAGSPNKLLYVPRETWPDGKACALGTSCNRCENEATWWHSKLFTACGSEPRWSDGKACALGTSCNVCQNKATWWHSKAFTACGSEPRWPDGKACALGTSCKQCQNKATYWYSKAFTACGYEPRWADGTRCLAGTSCNACANGYEWWDSKFGHHCGREPCWGRGKVCGAGTTCNNCCSGADCPWYKFGVCNCR